MVPPVNENAPEEGRHGLPLNNTVQVRVTLQVFARLEVLVTCAVKGIQAEVGVTVKAGTGGFSIQTVRVITWELQLLVVVNVTVYVPGAEYTCVGFVAVAVVSVCPSPKFHWNKVLELQALLNPAWLVFWKSTGEPTQLLGAATLKLAVGPV